MAKEKKSQSIKDQDQKHFKKVLDDDTHCVYASQIDYAATIYVKATQEIIRTTQNQLYKYL